MNADDKDKTVPIATSEMTIEQIQRHMLGLTSESESVLFERQLASRPAVAEVAKGVVADAFVGKVKRTYNQLKPRPQ